MRPPRLVALESSGADSSGLTEAIPEISGSVAVRLSEQRVVVGASYSAWSSLLAGDDVETQDRVPSMCPP